MLLLQNVKELPLVINRPISIKSFFDIFKHYKFCSTENLKFYTTPLILLAFRRKSIYLY